MSPPHAANGSGRRRENRHLNFYASRDILLISVGRFRGNDDAAARGWLYGIARNLIRHYHRRGRVELATCQKLGIQLDFDLDELAEIDAQIDATAQAGDLNDALSRLPVAQREALELRVVDELDYSEAAALMATTEENTRTRVSRALKALSLRLGRTAR